MKRIILLISLIFIAIGIDMGSKAYIEWDFAYDLCVWLNNKNSSSESIWGYFPEVFCQKDHEESILPDYEKWIRELWFPIVSDWIMIKLSYNDGVAFSLPIKWIILQIITILAILGICWHYIREEWVKNSRLLDTGYVLILAWALSHAYERIFVGHVVDFIAVKYFAILNFADIFISVGAFLIILAYVRTRQSR